VASDRAEALVQEQAAQRRRRELDRQRLTLEAQIASLRSQLDAAVAELKTGTAQDKARLQTLTHDRQALARLRRADRTTRGNGT